MDLTSILIQTLGGAGGGWLGDMLKKNGLGMIGNLVAGAVGGNALPMILNAAGVLGGGEGGSTNMIMSILTAVLGGGAGSLLGGLFKKAA